jgi:hypothetical protein
MTKRISTRTASAGAQPGRVSQARLKSEIARLRKLGHGWWEGLTEEQAAVSLIRNKRKEEYSLFLRYIASARVLWREHRTLIEAAEIPADTAQQLRKVLGKREFLEDAECAAVPVNVLDVGYEDNLIRSEREATKRVRSETVREVALRNLGVSN